MPLSTVEKPGFRELLQHFAPTYVLPSRGTVVANIDKLWKIHVEQVVSIYLFVLHFEFY